ncbi:MAG: 3'-5' exonuclease [Gemmatimonadetes bacterium]|nr:3'-5' exonuclease [Gemmatimonadota bacterium]
MTPARDSLPAGDEEGTPLGTTEFVVVDVETTGTGARRGDRVTEVAAVRVLGRTIEPIFDSLVNPGQPIPYVITALTGIDNAMVRNAPSFREIAGELAAHLAGRVFVAHNAAFDWGFLNTEFARVASGGIESLVPVQLCTVRLARLYLKQLPRRNLDAVCAYYGISNDSRHRAAGDAFATAQVLVRLIGEAERAGVWSLETLLKYGRQRRRRKRTSMPTWSDGGEGA